MYQSELANAAVAVLEAQMQSAINVEMMKMSAAMERERMDQWFIDALCSAGLNSTADFYAQADRSEKDNMRIFEYVREPLRVRKWEQAREEFVRLQVVWSLSQDPD